MSKNVRGQEWLVRFMTGIATILLCCFVTDLRAADVYLQRCADDGAFIASLYRSAYGREPGELASRALLSELESHQNREKLISGVFVSADYEKLQRPDREFVLDLFHGVLGREPKDDELAEKMEALREGKPRWLMVNGFIGSMEYKKIMRKCR